MSVARQPEEQRICREAARWLSRQDRGLSGAEQDEFLQWLAADPLHGEWLARHRASWNRLDGIAAWRPQHGAEPNPDVLARNGRRALWWSPWLLAAAAFVLMAGGLATWRTIAPGTGPGPVAPAGGYERRLLADGSVVELTGNAEIEVNFTPAGRHVSLRQGEAFFTVAKNPKRPFVGRAGGVDVRAVGTAFCVRIEPERIEVLVTEGRVQVAPPAKSTAPPQVDAGQLAVVPLAARDAARVVSASAADWAHLRAWQPQLLDFPSTPLSEVIAELNRRNRVQLVLADPALGRLLIAASIRSDNLEGFVHLLASTARLRAEPQGDYRLVLRASD